MWPDFLGTALAHLLAEMQRESSEDTLARLTRNALEECLRDEPQWRGVLSVEDVELDEAAPTSLN
jgi:hypothetical protein